MLSLGVGRIIMWLYASMGEGEGCGTIAQSVESATSGEEFTGSNLAVVARSLRVSVGVSIM